MIPSSLIYLGVMLAVIIVWFVVMKRPVYEAVLISFLLLLTITGTWGNVWVYVEKALSAVREKMAGMELPEMFAAEMDKLVEYYAYSAAE